MTVDDLAEHQSEFVNALSYTCGEEGHTVWECPPNGSVHKNPRREAAADVMLARGLLL